MKKSILILLFLISIFCARATAQTYSTNFSLTENPISENGNWVNGKATGLDWNNVATQPGLAYGLQKGSAHYTDGTAILTEIWNADQSAQATVYVGTVYSGDFPEVELRLRSSISAHSCTGYEIYYSVASGNPYMAVARWNGPVGNFTTLQQGSGSSYAVSNGDTVKATISGNTITAYINGVQKMQATDSTYTSGNPGIGFNQDCGSSCQGASNGYGFTSFSATGSAPPPSPCSGDSCRHQEGDTVVIHCFIATAAYGSYSHPDVKLLQDFRDKYLLTNKAGRMFVNCYYKLSPSIAGFISRSEILRATTKAILLKPVIYGIRYPYIFVLLFPAGIVVILWRKRATFLKYKKSS